jgi:thiol-disulfide isomerase/thioredoxin
MRANKLTLLSLEMIRAAIGVTIFFAVLAVAARLHPAKAEPAASEGRFPDMSEAVAWLNSPPLSGHSLRGKVVLVNFWTYSCINSLRELPYMKARAAKYKDAGLVVIGVHTPEFSFEKERANIEQALRDLKITYPVAIDTNYGIWQAFRNNYWPANYFIDGQGQIRGHHFGEGNYPASEQLIRELLRENGATGLKDADVQIQAGGVEAPPSDDEQSPETYVGYRKAERLASPERLEQDFRKTYTPPPSLSLDQWALGGSWNVGAESAVPEASGSKIVFRFHARDLHIVLGPVIRGRPVRFRIKLDGVAPGHDCGVDTAPDGTGQISEPRLYQLIRQKGQIRDRTFEIDFDGPGVRVFSFTFG